MCRSGKFIYLKGLRDDAKRRKSFYNGIFCESKCFTKKEIITLVGLKCSHFKQQ